MMTLSLSDIIVFDLDDTLYKEVSFVNSGFNAVAQYLNASGYAAELFDEWKNGVNAFQHLITKYSLPTPIEELLEIYRNHIPTIQLDINIASVLNSLVANGKTLGLITDGRSVTQRNKIKALGLTRWIAEDNIVISEEFGSSKPDIRNYEYFMSKYPSKSYSYIGDNTAKDFIAPNSLGWQTICLKDNGKNIHSQRFDIVQEYRPYIMISSLAEIIY